jgi:hypothetical protein
LRSYARFRIFFSCHIAFVWIGKQTGRSLSYWDTLSGEALALGFLA